VCIDEQREAPISVNRRASDKALLLIAAAWNLGAAAMLIFHPQFLLARLGINDPAARLLARSLASSAAAWGIGYALAAINARRFRNLIGLGALSKMLFAAIYIAAFFADQISFPAFIPGLVDLLLAMLLAEFLWRTKNKIGHSRF
jgi:hypothetical protein